MPTLEATVTATTTQTVQLKPALRRKLLNELKAYAGLRLQLKTIEEQMDKHKEVIGAIRDETGEQAIELEGYRVCLVAPIRKKFDAKKYVTLGGDLDIYNAANVDTPSKPYDKVTCPNDRNGDE